MMKLNQFNSMTIFFYMYLMHMYIHTHTHACEHNDHKILNRK